jgi:hypothetical protein
MATGAENLAKLQHVYAQWNETPKADFAIFQDGKIVKWTEFYDTAALQEALRPPEGAR